MGFDHDLAAKLAEKAITAAQNGEKLSLYNGNEISQLVMSVFAVGLTAIPVVGSVISSFGTLMALAAFPATTGDPWDKVRERVETLIGAKLKEARVKSLQAKVEGFKRNADEYAKVAKLYDDAKTPEEKKKHAPLMQTLHSGFMLLLRGGIPEFQVADYATVALPLFSRAANLHLTLLADGIKHGLEWGYPEAYTTTVMPDEFKRLTASGNVARDLTGIEARADNMELDVIKAALDAAEELGVSADLIALWKEAYATLIKDFATQTKRDSLSYVSHVNKYYTEGRTQVKPVRWVKGSGLFYGKGHNEALALQTYADYDMEMLDNALQYAEFWPYLDGKSKLPESAMKKLDREVFRGPYARYAEHVPWNKDAPAPVQDRGAKITAVKMCVSEDVRMLQVRYGDKWGAQFGRCGNAEREARNFDLGADEWIENVDLVYGGKLGQLTFTLNTGKVHGPFGDPVHAEVPVSVNRTGHALTSMYGTHYEHNAPEGLEGIIFGFRPLLTAK